MPIKEEFKRITGLELSTRQTNYLSDGVLRKDQLFSQLAILYYASPKNFTLLKRKIEVWLKDLKNETTFALAGYIHYIDEDYKKALRYFLENISFNPDNLDNWMDLAFALRHNGEDKISSGILFHYKYAIYYYRYLRLEGCGYDRLKKLVLEIIRRADAL